MSLRTARNPIRGVDSDELTRCPIHLKCNSLPIGALIVEALYELACKSLTERTSKKGQAMPRFSKDMGNASFFKGQAM
jgi:hypothetical protein